MGTIFRKVEFEPVACKSDVSFAQFQGFIPHARPGCQLSFFETATNVTEPRVSITTTIEFLSIIAIVKLVLHMLIGHPSHVVIAFQGTLTISCSLLVDCGFKLIAGSNLVD